MNIIFFQTIPNHFFHPKEWDGMGKMPTPNISLTLKLTPPRLGKTIPLIPSHPIPFHFFNLPNHSIPFYFFQPFFFNFPNSYTISLNLNHLYHLKIHKVKPFYLNFFSHFPNYFQTILEWSKMSKIVFPNEKRIYLNPRVARYETY